MQEKNIQYHTLYFDVPFEILLLYILLTCKFLHYLPSDLIFHT